MVSAAVAGGALITAGALTSITGNLNIVLLAGSRIPFAMAEQGQLPAFLARVHPRFFTPYLSILISGLLMLVLTLAGSFLYALTISVIARLLTYAATCAALPLFRQRENVPAARFRLPAGTLAAVITLALAAWLLSSSTLIEARDAGIVAMVGLLVYFAYRKVGAAPVGSAHRALDEKPGRRLDRLCWREARRSIADSGHPRAGLDSSRWKRADKRPHQLAQPAGKRSKHAISDCGLRMADGGLSAVVSCQAFSSFIPQSAIRNPP